MGKVGGAESAESAPPPKDGTKFLAFTERLAQANYRAVPKPGYKRVNEPAQGPGRALLKWPGVPQLAPGRLVLARGTLQFTPSHITSQPSNPGSQSNSLLGGWGAGGKVRRRQP